LDALFEQLARYELSSSPVPLEQLRSRIRASHGKAEQRRDLESRMVAVLENAEATDEGRRFLCQQLAVVGTDRSVPVLGQLLRHAELGRHACYALRGIDTAAAGATLRGALADAPPKVRLDIIQVLAQRGEGENVPGLIDLLPSEDGTIVAAAATALGTYGDTRATDALWDDSATAGVPAGLSPHCRLESAQALERSGKTKAALSAYRKLYAGKGPLQVRRGAMLGIVRVGGEEGDRRLLEVLQGDDRRLRLAAISNGLRLPGERPSAVLDRVLALLPKVPADEQVVWVRELTAQCGPAMTPHLTKLTRHDSEDVRAAALRGLVQLGDTAVMPALMAALDGGNTERELALAGLRQVQGNGVGKAITSALAGAKTPLRIALIGVLRDRGETDALPQLIACAADEDEAVARAAFQALGELADRVSLPCLLDRVLAPRNERAADRSGVPAILSAVRRHGAEEQMLDELHGRLGQAGVAVRCRILRIVAALPGERSVRMLGEARNSPEPLVREAAMRGMAEHSDPAVLPILQRIVGAPESDKYRVLAMRGMVRLLRGESDLDQKQRLHYYGQLTAAAQSDADWSLVLSGLAELPPRAALRLMLPRAEGGTPRPELQMAIDRAIAALKPVALFDGETFAGWEGNLALFRIEDGAVVGGGLDKPVPRNEYLCSTKSFADFELRLKFKVLGKNTNAGIQIRSERVANSNEMIGYQADLGQTWWGCLYDERRHKCLVKVAPKVQARLVKREQWNDYAIRCHGRRVQLWVNGENTVDYTEPDKSIPQVGVIGLQIHKGQPGEAWYKDIGIVELP